MVMILMKDVPYHDLTTFVATPSFIMIHHRYRRLLVATLLLLLLLLLVPSEKRSENSPSQPRSSHRLGLYTRPLTHHHLLPTHLHTRYRHDKPLLYDPFLPPSSCWKQYKRHVACSRRPPSPPPGDGVPPDVRLLLLVR